MQLAHSYCFTHTHTAQQRSQAYSQCSVHMHNSTRKPTRSASHTFAAALSGIIKPTHAASHALTAPLEGTLMLLHIHSHAHLESWRARAHLWHRAVSTGSPRVA